MRQEGKERDNQSERERERERERGRKLYIKRESGGVTEIQTDWRTLAIPGYACVCINN